jgi:Family of unknown function (DUF6353)
MLGELQGKAVQLVTQNASAILTGVGVAGTVGTAVLTGRAAFRASETLQVAQADLFEKTKKPTNDGAAHEGEMLTTKDKTLATWHLYLPAAGLGGLTIASIIFSNRISAKRAAALAAAYGVSERNFKEYREKTLEKLGINKEQKLRDEVAQEQVSKNPNHQVIMVGDGEVLCYDPMTGRYFKSTVEKLSRAMAQVHSEIYKYMFCSFTHFCDEVGLPPTDLSDQVGWNDKDIPEIHWSATTTSDDRPCLSIDFSPQPKPDYASMY